MEQLVDETSDNNNRCDYQCISYLIELLSIKLSISLFGLYNSTIILLLYLDKIKNDDLTLDIFKNNLKISLIIPILYIMLIIISYLISYCKKINGMDINLPKREFYWCWINIILLIWRDINKIIKRCICCCECELINNNINTINIYLEV
jgi:hypothetical protein